MRCRLVVSCPQVWRELFSPLHALNFGIGGDTTCNVLWRLQNGELENIRPKVRQACLDLQRKTAWCKIIRFLCLIYTFSSDVQNKLLQDTQFMSFNPKKENVHTLMCFYETEIMCIDHLSLLQRHACSRPFPLHLVDCSRSRWPDGPWLCEEFFPEQDLLPCYLAAVCMWKIL